MAYYRIEPFGEERADLRQAITSSLIANAFRGKKQRAHKPEEFMVVREPRKRKRMTGKQIKQSVKAFFGASK